MQKILAQFVVAKLLLENQELAKSIIFVKIIQELEKAVIIFLGMLLKSGEKWDPNSVKTTESKPKTKKTAAKKTTKKSTAKKTTAKKTGKKK